MAEQDDTIIGELQRKLKNARTACTELRWSVEAIEAADPADRQALVIKVKGKLWAVSADYENLADARMAELFPAGSDELVAGQL